MKFLNYCLAIIFGTFLIFQSDLIEAEIVSPVNLVNDFYEASQNGDLQKISSMISGPFLAKRKKLLENNPDYADYLIEHYRGVNIEVLSSDIDEYSGVGSVLVKRSYPDGSHIVTKFSLKIDAGGEWKIYDEELILSQ